MNTPVKVVTYVLLLALGVVVGIAGTLVSAAWFPLGLLLALLAAYGLCYGGLQLTGERLGAVAPAAGWLLSLVLGSMPRPEGDVLLGGGISSLLFMLLGTMGAVMCATVARPRVPAVPR